jgi:hypothetical protein
MVRAGLYLTSAFLLSPFEVAASRALLRDVADIAGVRDQVRSRNAVRARLALPDFEVLAPPPLRRGEITTVDRSVAVNLFDDVRLPVMWETVSRNLIDVHVWSGRIEGEPGSTITIAVKDEAISALITRGAKRYEIRPGRSRAIHEVIEIDDAAFPRECEPLRPSVPDIEPHPLVPRALSLQPAPAADDGTTWDILVAYTNVLRSDLGLAAVQTLITNSVASMNTAFERSNVTARLRLVGTMEVTYDDTLSTFGTILSRLATNNDGYMDEVHTRRDALGADAVSLLVLNPGDNICGTGYLLNPSYLQSGFARWPFAVIREDCAVGNLSFGHEVGHNFGLEHDRASALFTPSRTYAYGYRQPGYFRDIMSYECTPSCPKILNYSNPDVLHEGRTTGVNYLASNAADNARALNDNATIIANWRQGVLPLFTFTDDPLVAGTTTIKAVHLTELQNAVNSMRVAADLASVSWTDTDLVGVVVKATHITELRNALTPALTALGKTATYTDATLAAGTSVKAAHIQELRDTLK